MEYADDFIMSPKVDFAFKELMNDEFVRKGFLSAVLNIKDTDIRSTEMLNTNLRKEYEDEKQGVLDVRLIMNNDTELDIEMQVTSYPSWSNKSTFYLCKMVSEQTDINRLYTNMKKCIAINILNFEHIDNTKKFHTVYHVREDEENIVFTDKMEWHIIELPKLPVNTDGTTLYDRVRFIKSEDRKEFEVLAMKNDYLNAAYKKLDIISQDKLKRIEYTSRMKAIIDHNTIIAELSAESHAKGLAEGEKITTHKFIDRMKSEGISDEMIAKIVGNI